MPEPTTVDTADEPLGWCVVELMGHRRLAGHVSEQEIAGTVLLRLDIPGEPPITQLYSASAVYCITPTTEDIALRIAARSRPAPVARYELEPAKPAKPATDDAWQPADPEDFDG